MLKTLAAIVSAGALLGIGAAIGSSSNHASAGTPVAAGAQPTVTVTQTEAPPTPKPPPGPATTINNDGVYVIGQDIKPGTWHTSGGSQCYYATLNSTNTSDINDNNNFSGPETVSLSGVKALEINGGCTWNLAG